MFPRSFPPLALALAALLCTVAPAVATPPNIVFILADDYGWRDLGCYGSTFYETPQLDRLAAQGARFTQAYAACSVCSPTRASILTGKYPARLHLTDWLPGRPDRPSQMLLRPPIVQHLPAGEVTFAEVLRQAGYRTAFIGKWHLGGPEFYPEKNGFERNLGGCELGHPPSYFSPYKIPTLPDGPPGEYLTDRLTDEAVHFLEEARAGPFLLYLSHYAVHNPQQAKKGVIEKYRAKAAALPKTGQPEFAPEGDHQTRQIQDQPVYAAMIESLDESVGRVLAKLQELGLEENTLVIFTSDNGGLSTAEGSPTSNLPLRAGKGWSYEGGVREPLLIRWPGVAKPGSVCETPVISTDYYPTILEAAALAAKPEQARDGVSLVPLLKSGAAPGRALYWHYPHYSNQGGRPTGVIRAGNLKLIESFESMRAELYDLQRDPGEHRDLAAEMPDKVKDLTAKLHAWRTEVDAQMPRPNPHHAWLRSRADTRVAADD